MLCPQSKGKDRYCWQNCYVSHDASSSGKFFHLMRYSLSVQEQSLLSLVAIISFSSKITLPSSSNIGSNVCTIWCYPSIFLRHDTWNTLCIRLLSGKCNSYATWLIFLVIWYGPYNFGANLFFPPCLRDTCL